jgi:DnaJ-class molecular chaperone
MANDDIETKKSILRKQYLISAKKYHPDHNSNDVTSETKFKEITDEYKQKLNELNNAIITPKTRIKYTASFTITLWESITGCKRYVTTQNTTWCLALKPGIIESKIYTYLLPPNSLIFTVNILMPDHYYIENKKLFTVLNVNFLKLFFGGEVLLQLPNKERVNVKIPKRTKHDKLFIMFEQGLFNKSKNKREPLYIKINKVLI